MTASTHYPIQVWVRNSDWLTQMYIVNLVEHYYTDYRSLLSTTTICGTLSRLSIISNPGQILQNIQPEVGMKPNFTSVPAFLGIGG